MGFNINFISIQKAKDSLCCSYRLQSIVMKVRASLHACYVHPHLYALEHLQCACKIEPRAVASEPRHGRRRTVAVRAQERTLPRMRTEEIKIFYSAAAFREPSPAWTPAAHTCMRSPSALHFLLFSSAMFEPTALEHSNRTLPPLSFVSLVRTKHRSCPNAPCMYATGCSNKPVMTQQQKQTCTYWLMKVPCHNANAARPATVGP
jgi:hypothetical protein